MGQRPWDVVSGGAQDSVSDVGLARLFPHPVLEKLSPSAHLIVVKSGLKSALCLWLEASGTD